MGEPGFAFLLALFFPDMWNQILQGQSKVIKKEKQPEISWCNEHQIQRIHCHFFIQLFHRSWL